VVFAQHNDDKLLCLDVGECVLAAPANVNSPGGPRQGLAVHERSVGEREGIAR
jgi:hypothetical protein